jgi:hypothetical protein
MRAAKKIDLSNISKCRNLEILDLSHNMLDELDLTPLMGCSTLVELRIQSNHLKTLNLWPLVNCIELKEIDITENRLHGFDLSPIFLKTYVRIDSSVVISADSLLQYIFTADELGKHFQLVRTDAAPWTAPPVIMWSAYTDLAKRIEWPDIKNRIDLLLDRVNEDQWYSIQRGLLIGLGIEELAGFDGDPKQLLEDTDHKISFKEARQIIFDNTVKSLEKQLDNNGPTLFLDIEKMRKTGASKLIPKIVERRKREVESTIIPVKGSKVFLESLWMTHYGYHILRAANFNLETDLAGFNTIKENFEKLGMTIKTQNAPNPNISSSYKMSRGMHRHMLNFIRGYYD